MEFAKKVRFVRKKLQLTQQQLADALSISFATVNRWENGKVEPSKLAEKMFDDFCDNNFIKINESNDF